MEAIFNCKVKPQVPPKLRRGIGAVDMARDSYSCRRRVRLNGGHDFAANSQTAEIWR
jgi:hypothetical protein